MLPFGVVAAVVLFAALLGFRSASSPLAVKRRRIASLGLDTVREKARQRHGWTEERAKELEGDYRDFLVLVAENPNDTISPWSDALDLFWHEHILDTRKYDADCKRIFGRKVQHDPNISRDVYRHGSTVAKTVALREQQLAARQERRDAAARGEGRVATDGFDLTTFGCAADGGASEGGASEGHGGGHHHGGDGGGHHGGGGHDGGGGHGCGGHGGAGH
jgi:uncharacterized membrane protein YgcG